MISEARIYLTEDGRAVDASDPDGVQLLVAEGCEIADVIAAEHGLPLDVATDEQPAKGTKAKAKTADA